MDLFSAECRGHEKHQAGDAQQAAERHAPSEPDEQRDALAVRELGEGEDRLLAHLRVGVLRDRLQCHPRQDGQVMYVAVLPRLEGLAVENPRDLVDPLRLHADLSSRKGSTKSKKDDDLVMLLDQSTNVGDIVKAMNRMGVTPKDLITILQSIKAAGALQGDLEIL